jgi:quinoprotein glucose dehydrogenase
MRQMTPRRISSRILVLAGVSLLAFLTVTTRTAAQGGQEAYERVCAACHGRQGQGQVAPALVPFARGDQDLLRIVRVGTGNMMTGFSAADIGDAEIRAIAEYLRGLGKASGAPQAAQPPAAAGGAVTFGQAPSAAAPPVPDAPQSSRESRMMEWPYVGADPSNTRYSPLADVTPENVGRLAIAWRWRPEERPLPEFGTVPGNFTATPIMIDNVVYVSTNYNRVAALDAETGTVKWVYDPRAYDLGMPLLAGGFRHRGVTAWRDPEDGNKLRIFLVSRYRLYSLDAETGRPVSSFGDSGVVDTSKDLSWRINPTHFEMNAAPAIYKDLVILGSSIGDNLLYRKTPPGDVRAYHVRTGKLVWRWSSIPQSPSEVGADTWEKESWRDAGQIENWPGVTVDEQAGLVFIPTGNPGNLYYGGARPGDNLFAETLIAVDASTGKRKWHYQLVHHGLWDYSLPTQSMLMQLDVDGRKIDAVTQLTKHGMVFVFDRITGKPVWPIEERPVPQSNVPGERTAATQPFPTRPPPVNPQGVTLDDAFDLTPELQAAARSEMQKYRLGPLFTPPSLEGSLVRPGPGGTVSWGGGSFDPQTGMLYVKTSNSLGMVRLQKYDRATTKNPLARFSDHDWVGYELIGGRTTFMDGLPLNKPPYGFLVAIDMNRGEMAWRVPLGLGEAELRKHPALQNVKLPERLGTPGTPGSIVTGGGLVFVGGGDEAFFAFDKRTGREVWHQPLPRRTSGTPMTYRSRNGRQFILITTGSGSDQELIAFALPEK